jgi:hypothetical protein
VRALGLPIDSGARTIPVESRDREDIMKLRYEIRDSHNPTWRGQRFTSEDRARRELGQAVGEPMRWHLVDRSTGETIAKA